MHSSTAVGVISRATDYRFSVVIPVKAQSCAMASGRHVIQAQPSFHNLEVDVEMYVQNE